MDHDKRQNNDKAVLMDTFIKGFKKSKAKLTPNVKKIDVIVILIVTLKLKV